MFLPNQKVVCVDDKLPPEAWEYVRPIRKGAIYTVRDIVPGIALNGGEGEVAIYLVEIQNTVNPHGIERGYNAERFAPLNPVSMEEEVEEYAFAEVKF
ncbi:MAG: hypothetical protein RL693_258 [Verrucomicrobiota bacterium]|jgi:hypothetical protein